MVERLAIVLAVVAVSLVASLVWRRREGRFSEAGGAFDRSDIGLSWREKPSAVVVEFGGEHCGSCRIVESRLAKLASEIPEVRIVSLDIESDRSLAERYDVRRVPTLFVTDPNLRIVWRASGVPSEGSIREVLLGPDWAGRPHPKTPPRVSRRSRRAVVLEEGIGCEVPAATRGDAAR